MEDLLRNELVELYKELNIPDEVPEDIIYSWEPIEPIYNNIYESIAKDPIKYRYILDRVITNNFIQFFHEDTRNKLSLLYPDDEELAIKLLIETTSYYKIKYYPNDEGSWDDEDCDKHYRLINHCAAIYFTYKFRTFCWSNPAIKKVLVDKNITDIGEGFTVNPILYALYESRQKK
jgi:hypothetical protein